MNVRIFSLISYILLQLSPPACLASNPKPAPKKLRVDMGDNCVIQINDYFNGELTSKAPNMAGYVSKKSPSKTPQFRFGVQFLCGDNPASGYNSISKKYGAAFDSVRGRWNSIFPYTPDERAARELRSATLTYSLSAINSNGFYSTQDPIDGEPRWRVRVATYCLFGKKKHVCGLMRVMRISEPKTNQLPYILKILRSVEFLEPDTFDDGKSIAP